MKGPKKDVFFFFIWLDKAMRWDSVTGTQKPGSYPFKFLPMAGIPNTM